MQTWVAARPLTVDWRAARWPQGWCGRPAVRLWGVVAAQPSGLILVPYQGVQRPAACPLPLPGWLAQAAVAGRGGAVREPLLAAASLAGMAAGPRGLAADS